MTKKTAPNTKNKEQSGQGLVRLDKYLAHEGIASRREVKQLVEERVITINNKQATSAGTMIDPSSDRVDFNKSAKAQLLSKETIAVYKPRGYISSKDSDGTETIFDVFPQFNHLNTVGRLDKDSEGLILLSNDGMITKAVTGKDHLTEKEYVVSVREDITPAIIRRLEKGVRLRDGMTLPARAKKLSRHEFSITLREGRKHQIRRMANACRLTVTSLRRVRIGKITLGKLEAGQYRKLGPKEIASIKSVLGI